MRNSHIFWTKLSIEIAYSFMILLIYLFFLEIIHPSKCFFRIHLFMCSSPYLSVYISRMLNYWSLDHEITFLQLTIHFIYTMFILCTHVTHPLPIVKCFPILLACVFKHVFIQVELILTSFTNASNYNGNWTTCCWGTKMDYIT